MISADARSELKDWMGFCSATGVLPFSWSKHRGRVALSGNKSKRRNGVVVAAILGAYTIYLAYQHYATLHPPEYKTALPASKFLPFCWVAIYVTGYLWGYGNLTSYWRHGELIAGYLNAMLDIDDRLKTGLYSQSEMWEVILTINTYFNFQLFSARQGQNWIGRDWFYKMDPHFHEAGLGGVPCDVEFGTFCPPRPCSVP